MRSLARAEWCPFKRGRYGEKGRRVGCLPPTWGMLPGASAEVLEMNGC